MQNIIALIFDFDDTLGPDSTSSLLESLGVDARAFWAECAAFYADGWDPVPLYLYKLLQESQRRKPHDRITRSRLQECGRHAAFFKGVTGIFKLLENHLREANPDAKLEYYLISSGLGEILRNTKIARNFRDIWGCDFTYNTGDEIEFPRRIISFTDKTRYLFQIAKGIVGEEYRGKPFEVNRAVVKEKLRVPFEHMVFVGDGYTDIPCFSLVRKQGGVSFGVYDPENKSNWTKAWKYIEDQRISNLAPADYRKDAALTHNLMMAISTIAANIQLKERTFQG